MQLLCLCDCVEAVSQITEGAKVKCPLVMYICTHVHSVTDWGGPEGEPEKWGTLCVRFLHFLVVVEVEDKFKVFCVLDAFSYYTDRV